MSGGSTEAPLKLSREAAALEAHPSLPSLAPGRPRLSPDVIVPSGARDPAKRDCCVLVSPLAAVQGSGLLVPGCSETAPSETSAPGTEPRPIRKVDASKDQTEAEPASGGSNAIG